MDEAIEDGKATDAVAILDSGTAIRVTCPKGHLVPFATLVVPDIVSANVELRFSCEVCGKEYVRWLRLA